MSKQNARDRGPVDINTLVITDSGWDDVLSKATAGMRKDILFSRDISTSRGLTDDEKIALLRDVQGKAAAQLNPGLAVTLVTYADRPEEHTFLVTAA